MTDVLLDVRALDAGYDGIALVTALDLTVAAGEVVALLGANGAGKTSTLLTISGLLPRLAGEITLFGDRLLGGRPWRAARAGLAHVPEDRSLFFGLTTRENLLLGLPRRHRRSGAIDEVLDIFPALVPLLSRKAGPLSGGEQQMLALGRALVSRPRLLMIDEMSLGLAPIIVERLLPLARTIASETNAGVLLVEQHVPVALAVADRAYVMSGGRIEAAGAADELAARPDLLRASYLGAADV